MKVQRSARVSRRIASWFAAAALAAVACGTETTGSNPDNSGFGGASSSATNGKAGSSNSGSGGSSRAQGSGASGGGDNGSSSSSGGSNGSGGKTSSGAGGSNGSGGKTSSGAAGSSGASGSGGARTSSGSGGASATSTTGTGGKGAGGSSGSGGSGSGGGSSGGGGGGAAGSSSGSGGSSAGYHPCPTDATACKIMPFGDSITDGYNSDTPGGYRVELFKRAHADGKSITFVGSQTSWNVPEADGATVPPNHEGHSGWTIDSEGGRTGISTLLATDAGTESVVLKYKPDIILLMIGTNDCIDQYDLTHAPTRLGNLIGTIYSELPDVTIVVAQPIPSRGDASKGDDTGTPDRIKTYDDAIPAVVQGYSDKGKHVFLVDMYTVFNPNKASLLEDQWHPNLAGYVVLGDQWYSVVKSLL